MTFSGFMMYFWGALLGFTFGVLLQRGHLGRFHVIVGQLLLRDFRVVQTMLTAAAVGAVGVYFLAEQELATIQPVMGFVGELILGGVLFGIGLALLGYCPGTTLVAAGEGRKDAVAGVAGFLVGGVAYVLFGSDIRAMVTGLGSLGRFTLPEVTGTSAIPWIAALAVAAIAAAILGWRRTEHEEVIVHGEPIRAP